MYELKANQMENITKSGVNPDLDLSGGWGGGRGGVGGWVDGFVLLALQAFLLSVISSFVYKIRGQLPPPPRAPPLDPSLE